MLFKIKTINNINNQLWYMTPFHNVNQTIPENRHHKLVNIVTFDSI